MTGRRGGAGADRPDPPAGQAGSTPTIFSISIEDPGCLSQIPDPDFFPSRIPDLTTIERSGNFCFVALPFFVVINFSKLEII